MARSHSESYTYSEKNGKIKFVTLQRKSGIKSKSKFYYKNILYLYYKINNIGDFVIRNKISVICSENPSLIENYDKAINDDTQMWVLHHRYEVTINGEPLLTSKELKAKNLYFHRPASELIFLTPEEHVKIHLKKTSKPVVENKNTDSLEVIENRNYQREYRKKYYKKNPTVIKDYLMKRRYISLPLEKLEYMLHKREQSIGLDAAKKERLIRLIKEAIDTKKGIIKDEQT